jgi:hypothetical protein
MPKIISTAREVAYLRALAETGNATLAAERARVSRDWAYKKRKTDARFDAWCREMAARFGEMPPPLHGHSIDPNGPMEPSSPLRPASLSREGRGNKRVRVNRDRAGGWTAELEARFIERLRATCSVPIAAAEVGLSTVSAYRRRQVRPGFAEQWDEALRTGWPPAEQPWIESAMCFLEGQQQPPGNPVGITSVAEVLQGMWGTRFASRGTRFAPRGPRRR